MPTTIFDGDEESLCKNRTGASGNNMVVKQLNISDYQFNKFGNVNFVN